MKRTINLNNVYVGWDSREDIAFQVAQHSIHKHNPNVNVLALKQHELRDKGGYWRDVDLLASTEFSFTRFLVPNLNHYSGWAVFVDCDFLFTTDIGELFDQADSKYAVQVVKHDYTPKETVKMDGKTQHLYPRKNWSSMILFNCAHPSNAALDLVNVNTQSGAWLHQFKWLKDEEIGELSPEWNWLVGWYKEPEDGKPKAIHYTQGGPWFKEYADVEYGDRWIAERNEYYKSW